MNWSLTPFAPEEVARNDGETYHETFFRVLNNFHFRFPFGNTPNESKYPEGYYKTLAISFGHFDKVFGEAHPSVISYGISSERRMKKTSREFFAEIETAVKELGFSESQIAEALNVVCLCHNDDPVARDGEWKLVWEMLCPIYIELRKRGYSKQDLIS